MEAAFNILVAALLLSALIGPFIVQMRIEKKREDMLRKHVEGLWAKLREDEA